MPQLWRTVLRSLRNGTRVTSTPILATKLHIPRSPRRMVPRPHLIERLDDGLDRNLTLVSAPAGFGKTTLVSTWAGGCDRPVAWLSLDDGDNDPTRFLSYLVAALRTIAPNLGERRCWRSDLLSHRRPKHFSPICSMRSPTSADSFVLVLDDYHVIDARPVDLARRLSARAFATPDASGHRHPRGSAATTGAATRPRPTVRAARQRPAFYPVRSRGISQAGDGPRPLGRTGRHAGSSDRRLDRRPAVSRALIAGTRGRRQLHRILHRQPPLRPGLPARRSAAAAVRPRPDVPAAHIDPRPSVRPAV